MRHTMPVLTVRISEEEKALLAARSVSSAGADLPLHVEVMERAPYTTTLRMTYWFAAGIAPSADPDLVVRVYRDARLAEACSCSARPHHRALSAYARQAPTELERRWLMNVMLNKWLEYCLEVGHRRPTPVRSTLACLKRAG